MENYYSNVSITNTMDLSQAKDNVDIACMENENQDRYVVSMALPQIFKKGSENISVTQMPLKWSYDMEVDVDTPIDNTDEFRHHTIAVEVKNLTHTYMESGEESVLLKKGKLYYINKAAGEKLTVYIAIVNGILYMFDLKHMDWKNTYCEMRYQKVRQLDPNSEWKHYPTYHIPLKKAVKICDVSKFIKDYQEGKREYGLYK